MALQVWLPLNKNGADKNQGLANISVDNSAVYSDSGKLGGCYFYKDDLCQSFNNNLTSIIGEKRSICVWVKPAGNHIHYTGAIVSSGNWNSSNWTFGVNSNNTGVTGFGSGYSTYLSCNVPVNEWTHLTCVTNGTHHDIYKNGSYIGSLTSGDSLLYSDASNTTIGRETYAGGYFGFNGYINDVRIYDHCLSSKEVKEISRGMVLHYKMCQPERSENLYVYNSISTGGFSLLDVPYPSFSHNSATRTTTITNNGGGGLRISNLGLNGYSGHLTISFYAWASKACSFSLDCCDYDCTPSINLTTVKKKFVVNTNHVTDRYNTSDNYNGFIDWNFSNTSGAIIYIQDLKVEKGENPNPQWSPAPSDNPNWGTIEYDGSGFKNHGTVSGNVTLSADSPRYTGSYNLSNGNYITAPGFTYINSGSISFWAKINTIASNGWLPFTGPTTGYYIMASTGGTGSFYHNAAGKETKTIYEDGKVITAPSSIGVWHHYVITNVDLTTWTKFMINNYDSNWNAELQMSDVRVYATALDATDVAELYELGKV